MNRCTKRLTVAAVILYTAARIVANVVMVETIGHSIWTEMHPGFGAPDLAVRPVITGLGLLIFLLRPERFSARRPLHRWSRRNVLLLAVFFWDPWFRQWLAEGNIIQAPTFLLAFWQMVSNAMQVRCTSLKLRSLGSRCLARCTDVSLLMILVPVTAIGTLVLYLIRSIWDEPINAWARYFLIPLVLLFLAVVLLQSLSLTTKACRAVGRYEWHEIQSTVCCLWTNAVLIVLGPALSFYTLVVQTTDFFYISQSYWLTLDFSLQIFNSLLLSGMLGWKEWARPLEAFHQLAEEAGLGLAFKRVAFPGAINPEAQSCIASFPGKYSELWDDAVAIALEKHDVCSLACVFLTDTASGLGRHAANPDCPGDCWCRALYGTVPPIAYLSVVDPSCEGDELAFKQADAAAMGQHLLVKKSHTSTVESDHELANALQEAQRLCERNEMRAPWGCEWFEQWKKNIHRALELHQTLHVFYFEGRRGLGKLSWDELGDQAAKDRARKNGGLGASQTAEVAYLDKLGVPYVEHDIAEFYSFVSQQSVEVSVDDSVFSL